MCVYISLVLCVFRHDYVCLSVSIGIDVSLCASLCVAVSVWRHLNVLSVILCASLRRPLPICVAVRLDQHFSPYLYISLYLSVCESMCLSVTPL